MTVWPDWLGGCAWFREGCAQAVASPVLGQVGLDSGAAPGERAGIGKEAVTVRAQSAHKGGALKIAESSAHSPTDAMASASLGEMHSQARKSGVGVRWSVRSACRGQERAGAGSACWGVTVTVGACSGTAPPRPQLGFSARHCT